MIRDPPTSSSKEPSPLGLDTRKAILEFGDGDVDRLVELRPTFAAARERFVDQFYAHLLRFEETRVLIADPATLERLKRMQGLYFDRLFAGSYDEGYGEDRRRVGVTHHRIGLEPTWYMGVYALYLRLLLPEVQRATGGDWERALPVIEAILKVVFLDMGIAIDAYHAVDRRQILDLKQQNERIFQSMPAGLLVVDPDLKLVAANRSFCKSCGCEPAQLVGQAVVEVLGIADLQEPLGAALAGGTPRTGLLFTARCSASGVTRPVRITVTGLELAGGGEAEEERLLVVVEDLSEEERLGALARASERRFEEVVENATDGIVLMDKDGYLFSFNRSAEAMFGWRREEVLGKPATLLMPEKYRATHDHGIAQYIARTRMPGTPQIIEGLRRDGSSFPMECTISAYSVDGTFVFTGVVRDITERKRGEAALTRSEGNFRALIERSPDSIVVHRQGRFVYVNAATAAYLGYDTPEELAGRPMLDIVHPDDLPSVAERIRMMLEFGVVAPAREERFLRRDGSIVTAEVVALPLVFDGEPAIVVLARDVTARKELTAKIMQMDRMIAVGTLAAGVGHEINNPLAYVVANLDFLARELPGLSVAVRGLESALTRPETSTPGAASAALGDTPRRLAEFQRAIDEAREGAERVRKIVRDLKTFSRAEEDVREPLALECIIESAVDMAWSEIRHRARLVKEYGPTPHVEASESRLGQVFLNVLVNAAQAIPEGQADGNQIRIVTRTDELGRAVVEIRDSGSGIPPEIAGRIFDPFFTTKPVGQGTGLGLSICQGIVQGIGGEITVESEVGKGTTVRVILPAAHVQRVEPPLPQALGLVAPGRRGSILIVDDEPLIGMALRRILSHEHEVVVVARGREAIERIERGERFDLVLCDLMMPEMTGMDLHAELERRFPEYVSRMIFMTGGAFTPRAHEFLDKVPNQCLAKPFDVRHVQALVRDHVR